MLDSSAMRKEVFDPQIDIRKRAIMGNGSEEQGYGWPVSGKRSKSCSVWPIIADVQRETFIRNATMAVVEMRSDCAEKMGSVQRHGYLEA